MTTSKYFKNLIVTKYSNLINEYFDLMDKSEIIKNLTNANHHLYIGLVAIHRVFEYVLIKMNNLNNAYFYSQRSYCYYLEYLEQVQKSELSNNLNHIDSLLFVYKKSIFDIYNGETNSSMDTSISNILTLDDSNLSKSQINIKEILNDIYSFTKTLFAWDNIFLTFDNRIMICKNYLLRYLTKYDILKTVDSYLEMIQQKTDLSYKKYDELLFEFIYRIEKNKKHNIFSDEEKNDFFLIKFYIEKDIFHEKFYEETTKDLVNWLFIIPNI